MVKSNICQKVLSIIKRSLSMDKSILKELHADPKTSQQIEFVCQLKKAEGKIDDGESMFVLTI